MTRELHGACGCGALRYRLKAEPMVVHCCHCRDCQRQTGTAFVLNAVIERDNVEIETGKTTMVTMPTASGRPHDVYRCSECGTAMWSDYGRRKTMIFVRVGTLDEPSALAPDVHVYTRSKLPWVRLPEGVPAYDAFYPALAEVWSPDALARRRALGF